MLIKLSSLVCLISLLSCSGKASKKHVSSDSYEIVQTVGKFAQTKDGLWMISPSASQESDFAGAKHYWIYEDRTAIQSERQTKNGTSYFPPTYMSQKLGHDFYWSFPTDSTVSYVSESHPDGSTRSVPQWTFQKERFFNAKLDTPQLTIAPSELTWKYKYDFYLRLNASSISSSSFKTEFLATCTQPGSRRSTRNAVLASQVHHLNINQGWNSITLPFEFNSEKYNTFKRDCDSLNQATYQFVRFEGIDLSNAKELRFLGARVTLSDLALLGTAPAPEYKILTQSDPIKIWDIRSDCQENNNTYWLCKSKETQVAADRVSATANGIIKSLLFINSLSYKFTCEKARITNTSTSIDQPLDIFIDSQKIAASPNTISFNTPVPYASTFYRFGIFPSPSANFWPECSVELVNNTTTAPLETLRAYKQLIQLNLAFYEIISDNLKAASTIEGKAAEISGIPIFLESQNLEIQSSVKLLESERAILKSVSQRSSYEEQRLADIGVLISNKQNEITQNMTLLVDIRTALQVYEECGERLCSQKIDALSNRIVGMFDVFTEQMLQLHKFLDDEVRRLESKLPTYANQMKDLYCEYEASVCKYRKTDGSYATWSEANSSTEGGSSGSGGTPGGTPTGGGGTNPPAEDIVSDSLARQTTRIDNGKQFTYIEDRLGLTNGFGVRNNRRYFPQNYYDDNLFRYPFWTFNSTLLPQFQIDLAPNPDTGKLLTFKSQDKPMDIESIIHIADFEDLVAIHSNWSSAYSAYWNVLSTSGHSTTVIKTELLGYCNTGSMQSIRRETLDNDQIFIQNTNGTWHQLQSQVSLNHSQYTSFVSFCLLQLGKPSFQLKQSVGTIGNVELQYKETTEVLHLPPNPVIQPVTITRETSEITNISVFNVKNDCDSHKGTHNNCPNVNLKLQLDKPSATDDVFIRSLLYTNRINYVFRCNKIFKEGIANPIAQPIEAYFGEQKISPSSAVITKETATFHHGTFLALKTIVDPFSIIWPECHYTILSNISYSHTNSLAAYKNFLKESAELFSTLNRQFDLAEELPAQWAVIANLPKIVDYQILKNTQDISFTQQRISQLQSTTPDALESQQQLLILRNYLDQLNRNLAASQTSKSEITEIVSQTASCQNSTDAYCLTSLKDARNILNGYANANTGRIVNLEQFLLDEIERIQTRETQLAAMYKTFFCELLGKGCDPTKPVEVLRDKHDQVNPPATGKIDETVLTGGENSIEQWSEKTVSSIESSTSEAIPMPETITIAHPFGNYQRGVPEVDQKYDALMAEKAAQENLTREERALRYEIQEAQEAATKINNFLADHDKMIAGFNAAAMELNELLPQITSAIREENNAKAQLEPWINAASAEILALQPPTQQRILEIENEFRRRSREAKFCVSNKSSYLARKGLEIYARKIMVYHREYSDIVNNLYLPAKYSAPKQQGLAVLAKLKEQDQSFKQQFDTMVPLRESPPVCSSFAAFEIMLNFVKESQHIVAAGVALNNLNAQSLFEQVDNAAQATEMETSMRRFLLELEGRFYKYLSEGQLIEAASISDTIQQISTLFYSKVGGISFWTPTQKAEFVLYIAEMHKRIAQRKFADLENQARLNTLSSFRTGNLHAEFNNINTRFNGYPTQVWQSVLDWASTDLSMRPGSPFAAPSFTARSAVFAFDEKLSDLDRRLVEFRAYQPKTCDGTPHGTMSNRTRYQSRSVSFGGTCQSEVQKALCLDGVAGLWSGTFTFESCEVLAPLNCGTLAHEQVETRLRYESAETELGGSCRAESQTRSCNNGVLTTFSGSLTHETCRENRTRYSWISLTDTCQMEQQSRVLGQDTNVPWSGTYSGESCNESRTRYQSSLVAFGKSCVGEVQTRTMTAGTTSPWSGTFTAISCQVADPANCGSVAHNVNESRTMYKDITVPFGSSCQAETQSRLCYNGSFGAWSGTYSNPGCSVAAPASCGTVAHNGTDSRIRYLSNIAQAGSACVSETQTTTCNNGTFAAWTGSYVYDSCIADPASQDKDGDGVVASMDCNDSNNNIWQILVKDNDKDGFPLAGSDYCGGAVTATTLRKSTTLVNDNNDASEAVIYTVISGTISEGTSNDWNLNKTLNETHTVHYIANPKQWLDLAKKCTDANTTLSSCAAKVKLTRDLDFTNLPTFDTTLAVHSDKCDMNFDGDTVDTLDKPCMSIASNKYALGAPSRGRPFTGVIDGSSYQIMGLRYNLASTKELGGIVRSVNGGTVRDIGFEGSMKGSQKVGGIVGWLNGGSLYRVRNSGSIYAQSSLGGVAGVINFSSTNVPVRVATGLINSGSVTSTLNGLCGVGGVIGIAGGDYMGPKAEQLGNTGAVTASTCSWVGGVVGLLDDAASLAYTYNSGAVSGKTSVGGVVGLAGATAAGIRESYSIGSLKGTTNAGAFIGELYTNVPASGFWARTSTAPSTLKGIGLGTSVEVIEKTRNSLYQQATYTASGWDFAGETANGTQDIWTIIEAKSVPMFTTFSQYYKPCPNVYPQPGTCP